MKMAEKNLSVPSAVDQIMDVEETDDYTFCIQKATHNRKSSARINPGTSALLCGADRDLRHHRHR